MIPIDCTTQGVTKRERAYFFYASGTPLTVDNCVAFVKPLPKSPIVIIDREPIGAPSLLVSCILAMRKARPDGQYGVYGATDLNTWAAGWTDAGLKALAKPAGDRTFQDSVAIANMRNTQDRDPAAVGIEELEKSRRANEVNRPIFAVSDLAVIRDYPMPGDTPESIAGRIEAIAAETYRASYGLDLMLLVTPVLDIDHQRLPLPTKLAEAMRDTALRVRTKYLGVWDGNEATKDVVEPVMKILGKRSAARAVN